MRQLVRRDGQLLFAITPAIEDEIDQPQQKSQSRRAQGKNPDNPFPESDDNPSFEDVSPQDENEVTVILPEELTEEVGDELTEEIPGGANVAAEHEDTGEVFVLLPDGDDTQIPMVETQELADVTEDVGPPRLTSVYESTTASQVGLRTDNPAGEQAAGVDTEIDPHGEPTEDAVATDHPTETMSAGDLDDFANEVADDMLVAEGNDPSVDRQPIAYDDEDLYDDQEEPVYEDEETYGREKLSSFKKVVLSLAALIAIAGIGVHFFPGHVGLDPSFDLKEFVMGHVNSLIGGREVVSTGDPVTPPDGGDPDGSDGGRDATIGPLAMATQEMFKSKFRQAIELGFGEVPR